MKSFRNEIEEQAREARRNVLKAVKEQNVTELRRLIADGANLKGVLFCGKLFEAIFKSGNKEIFDLVIMQPGINFGDAFCNTPKLDEKLGVFGYNINHQFGNDETVLISYVKSSGDRPRCEYLLTEMRANPLIKDNSGKTALDYAHKKLNGAIAQQEQEDTPINKHVLNDAQKVYDTIEFHSKNYKDMYRVLALCKYCSFDGAQKVAAANVWMHLAEIDGSQFNLGLAFRWYEQNVKSWRAAASIS